MTADPLTIAGKSFRPRLIVGTGKYRSMDEMRDAIEASGAEIVTVAIRRLPLDPGGRVNPDEPNLMDYLDWQRYTILPNTAGCRTADEALFTARLARELTGSNWLEPGGDPGPRLSPARPGGDAGRRPRAHRRGVHRPALHPRRPDPRPASGGDRLRHRHAARLAHRVRAGHPYAWGGARD